MKTIDTLKVKNLKERLLIERENILHAVEKQMHCSDDPKQLALANRLNEVDDWALASLQSDIDIAILGHELTGLRDIDAALKRIAKGVYGICDECGKQIDMKRLNAQPSARLCLGCKEAFEKRRGIVSRPTY
jgi:DnaK suppressor protein